MGSVRAVELLRQLGEERLEELIEKTAQGDLGAYAEIRGAMAAGILAWEEPEIMLARLHAYVELFHNMVSQKRRHMDRPQRHSQRVKNREEERARAAERIK